MTMAEAFTEWARRLSYDPEVAAEVERNFLARFKRMSRERRAKYGEACARYLRQLMREPSPKAVKRKTKKRAARRVR